MTTNRTPEVTYAITEGQLVRLCDGVPEDAVDCDAAFESEGYPGIANDFEACKAQRDDLVAALEQISQGRLMADREHWTLADVLQEQYKLARIALAKVNA
jgi:hypothetical protein